MDKWRKLVVFEWVFIVCSVGCENVNIIVTCQPNPYTHIAHTHTFKQIHTHTFTLGQVELTQGKIIILKHIVLQIHTMRCDAIGYDTYIWICYAGKHSKNVLLCISICTLFIHIYVCEAVWVECHFFLERERQAREIRWECMLRCTIEMRIFYLSMWIT